MNNNEQTTGICGMSLSGTTYTLWAFQKRQENETEWLYGEMVVENFPNLGKDMIKEAP